MSTRTSSGQGRLRSFLARLWLVLKNVARYTAMRRTAWRGLGTGLARDLGLCDGAVRRGGGPFHCGHDGDDDPWRLPPPQPPL